MCRVLNLSEPHRVASRLDDDGKGRTLITTPGGPQEMTIISEAKAALHLREDPGRGCPEAPGDHGGDRPGHFQGGVQADSWAVDDGMGAGLSKRREAKDPGVVPSADQTAHCSGVGRRKAGEADQPHDPAFL